MKEAVAFSWSETKVMKIESKEQSILGLHANFEPNQGVHVRTEAKNVGVRNI